MILEGDDEGLEVGGCSSGQTADDAGCNLAAYLIRMG